ncbi:MAG TPA: LPS export ABC transporter periplasmic protein LptC [bacterium]|nr:LPS export ABC transporter periplasmic protein LptC [bacterium]
MSRWFPWFALLGLAALSSWASLALYQPLPSVAQRSTGADHAFLQPIARVFDKEGQAAYDIHGTQLEHRAENDEYLLAQARLRLYTQSEDRASTPAALERREYWDIQAERARIMADREHLQLEGQVRAERRGVLPEQSITVHAQDVTLAHKAQTASSTHPVTVDGANWQSQSSAFQANLSTEQLEQTGRVHDRYQPPKP